MTIAPRRCDGESKNDELHPRVPDAMDRPERDRWRACLAAGTQEIEALYSDGARREEPMSSEGPQIQAIGQIAVTIVDLDRAVAFYQQVLQLPLLFRFPGLAFFDCGGVRLMLSRPEKPELAGTSIIYYRVPSIQAAAAAIEG